MSITTRKISTGLYSGPPMDRLDKRDERHLWGYLQFCESTAMCGFFPISLGRVAGETLIPLSTVIESMLKFEEHGIAIYDDGWLFLPAYAGTTGPPLSWIGWPEHVAKTARLYTGRDQNRAWLDFQRRFREMIVEARDAPRIPRDAKRGKGGKFQSPEAAERPPRPLATATPVRAKATPPTPRGRAFAAPTSELTFQEALEFFRAYESPGLHRRCPEPAQDHADAFFAWAIENERDDWRKSARSWIDNLLRDESEEARKQEAGFAETEIPGVKVKLW